MNEEEIKQKPQHLITAFNGWGRKPGQQRYNTIKGLLGIRKIACANGRNR
jgi:hypothetical protein